MSALFIGLLIVGGFGFYLYSFLDDLDIEGDVEEVLDEVMGEELVGEEVETLVYDGSEPVFVTIYAHNEDSWASLIDTEQGYLFYRAGLIERAELLKGYDIEWDWQSDLPVIEAIEENDVFGAPFMDETNGENVLVYIESLGVDIDPHVHTNNLADVAYLMEQLGASPSGVIGGSRYIECGRDHLDFLDFVSWRKMVGIESDGYVYGNVYPDAKWKPTILSGPAMGGHWFDDWTSGVWMPGDEDAFYDHDESNEIIYIGEGYPHDSTIIGSPQASGAEVYASDGSYIQELVEKITNGELATGTTGGDRFMYTASIHIRDIDVVRERGEEKANTVEGLSIVLDELEPLREAGLIEYVTFEQAASIWNNKYGAVPHQVNLEDFSFYEEVEGQARQYCKK